MTNSPADNRDRTRLVRPPDVKRLVALLGNPNVGKSTLFNSITGLGVSTAHYPGTTREVQFGLSTFGDTEFTLADLPGAYSLYTDTEESWVSRRALLDIRPDAVVVVVDAGNLGRNLKLVLEVLDLGLPCVLAVNLVDEAERAGIGVDAERLSSRLGVQVVQTVATQGLGVRELVTGALHAIDRGDPPPPRYTPALEAALGPLAVSASALSALPYGLSPRALALQLISGVEDFSVLFDEGSDGARLTGEAEVLRGDLVIRHDEPVTVWLSRERSTVAERVAAECIVRAEPRHRADGWRIATSPLTGIPLLLLVLGGVFAFLFFIGDFLAGGFSALWAGSVSPLIRSAVTAVAGDGSLGRTLLWGLDSGIEASLAIGLPYILTFYVILGVLEDTGYLNALAFLADRAMHRMGLHGHALIPLVAAAGCNVPAILAVRSLPDRRERLIASTLVALVPCSARTAVVLGAVGHYIGMGPALGVLAVVFVLWVLTGLGLNMVLPGKSAGLVMEVFPFRRPSVRGVLRKAWGQFREFLFVATPIVVAGSLILGGLYETGLLTRLSEPLAPVVEGWLGLPAVAGLTLLIGTLRKELALQLLVVMAVAVMGAGATDLTLFMTPTNLFVYALVNTIAVPCVSTIAVLAREHGWWRTSAIVGFTIVVGVAAGSVFAHVLPALAR